MGRRPVRSLLLYCCCALALLAGAAGTAHAGDIDDYAYDYAKSCRDKPQPGTRALERWLEGHAKGESWGIMRCEKFSSGNYSLHSEGRAIDWRLNAFDRSEKREARRLIKLFLKRDRNGNNHALARRMGIQELIWNCRSWWAGDGGMEPYSACERDDVDNTTAHRDHIHIGLNWRGARMKTTFWRNRR